MKSHHAWIIAIAALVAIVVILYATRLGDDDEITRQVFETLQNHPSVDASQLQIVIEDGVVTISGNVPDLESKRIAIEEARRVHGVDRVVDNIEIDEKSDEKVLAIPDDQEN